MFKNLKVPQIILAAIGLFFMGCQTVPPEVIKDIPVPTSAKISEPNLYKSKDGNIYLSWIEVLADTTSALKFSTLKKDNSWSEPKTIAQGNNWFVNWADFPGMTSFGKPI